MPSKQTIIALKARLAEIDRNANYYEYMTIYCNLKKEMANSKEEAHALSLEQEKDVEYSTLPTNKKVSLIRRFINFIKNIFAKKEKKEKEEEKEIPDTSKNEIVAQKEETAENVEIVKTEDTKVENVEVSQAEETKPAKEEETELLDMTAEEELLEEIDDDIPDVNIDVPDLKEDTLSIDIGDNVDRKIV